MVDIYIYIALLRWLINRLISSGRHSVTIAKSLLKQQIDLVFTLSRLAVLCREALLRAGDVEHVGKLSCVTSQPVQ